MSEKKTTVLRDEQRVIEALRFGGINATDMFDLVNTAKSYKGALPILVKLLPVVTDSKVKEGIIRALSIREARGISTQPLLLELKKNIAAHENHELINWTLANALSVVADDAVFGDIADLVRNRQVGKAREMLALALGNMKRTPAAVDLLLSLLDDDQVNGHAVRALGNLRAKGARRDVERLLSDPRSWVRQEAKRALKKLE